VLLALVQVYSDIEIRIKGNSMQTAELEKSDLEKGRGLSKTREGIVVSDKMDKTIVVAVTQLSRHSAYGKYVRVTKKYHTHDEEGKAKVGDTVRIVESRPLSKSKRWRLQKVLVEAVRV